MRRRSECIVIAAILGAVLAWGGLTTLLSPIDRGLDAAKEAVFRLGEDNPAYAQARQIVSPLTFSGAVSKVLASTAIAYSDPISVWGSERLALETVFTDGASTDVDISWQAASSVNGTFYSWTGSAALLKEAAAASEFRVIDTSKGHIAPYVRIKYEGSGSHSTVTISGNLIHK